MTITIKVEAQVPYTQTLCIEEFKLDFESFLADEQVIVTLLRKSAQRVNDSVTAEMQLRGIELDEAGFLKSTPKG